MDRKYQVFISSTFKDLKTARQRVSETILSMGHFPVGMEMFGARNEGQWEVIKQTIDQTDYYIVIVGRCFGSQVPGEEISYTQKEYQYAKEKNIPILAFIASDDADIAPSFQDKDPEKVLKLNAFKQELETGRTVDYWTNYDNLATKVAISLPNAIASRPMVGWLRVENTEEASEEKKKKDALHYVEIKKKLEDGLIDYSWVKTSNDRRQLAKEPWRKFRASNLILRDIAIKNPSHGNGLIKVEPYDFYDEGILVFSARGGAVVSIKTEAGEQINESIIDTYVVNVIPFSRIISFDERGSVNEPYPTLHCRFEKGTPYKAQWYIEKKTGIRYKEEQVIEKEEVSNDDFVYVPTPISSTDRRNITLYACIMALFASEDDGRIKVIPSYSTSYIAGNRNVERNQTPRELARWDDAVSKLYGQGYIKRAGNGNHDYMLTEDGYNLAERFKEQCNVNPTNSSDKILKSFGVPEE